MTPILKVLVRTLTVEFYKQNAAFFGLIFLILFGFIKAGEHLAIGAFLVANPSSLIFLYLLCIAYGFKIMLFVNAALLKKQNRFLQIFSLFPVSEKIKSIVGATLLFLFPVIAYACFLLAIAFSYGFYMAVLSINAFLVFIVAILSLALYYKLINLNREKHTFQFRLFRKRALPRWYFFIAYLLRFDPVLLILSKIYACLIIIGASALYDTDQFDLRVLSTGVLLSFVGNTAILHKYIWFTYHKMRYNLNLPESFLSYLLIQFVTFALLLSPEFIVLGRYYPLQPQILDLLGIFLFGFGISLLIFALQLLKQLELSDFMIKVFWLIVISTFLILFSIHPLIMALMYIFIALTISYFYRFRFEFIEKAH